MPQKPEPFEPPPEKLGRCVCCGKPGKQSIMLAIGRNRKSVDIGRYYIPNYRVRHFVGNGQIDVTKIVPFCATCMRRVEDNLRATILYLHAENGQLAIKNATSNKSN
jgi:hypothetical protein